MSTAYKANGKVHSMTLDVDGSEYIKGVAVRTGLTAMGRNSVDRKDRQVDQQVGLLQGHAATLQEVGCHFSEWWLVSAGLETVV